MQNIKFDSIRYRNKVGTEISAEVLRNYLKRKDRNLDKLMKYAANMRITLVLNHYLTAMLSKSVQSVNPQNQ